MKKTLLGLSLIALLASPALANKDKWADLAEQCLKNERMYSEDETKRSCYVTERYTIYCKKEIAIKCSEWANEQLRPKPRVSRNGSTQSEERAPSRRQRDEQED